MEAFASMVTFVEGQRDGSLCDRIEFASSAMDEASKLLGTAISLGKLAEKEPRYHKGKWPDEPHKHTSAVECTMYVEKETKSENNKALIDIPEANLEALFSFVPWSSLLDMPSE